MPQPTARCTVCGATFPAGYHCDCAESQPTLRDEFALGLLPSIIAKRAHYMEGRPTEDELLASEAKEAYRQADAMLAARARGNSDA